MNTLRIGLDLDDTVFAFMDPYIKKFGIPKSDYEITKNVTRKLIKDKNFWMNQPLIRRPNFDVTLYCTKRVHNKRWTKKQIELNNLPKAPVYQIYTQTRNKADLIKGRVDVFIDDSISNMQAMNKAGLPCLLITSKENQHFNTSCRINSLNYQEIEQVYNQNFKK